MPGSNLAILPIAFGAKERRLIGVLHFPAACVEPRDSVLICPAFGQEAIRAHRMMRVLADRLAAAGHVVLRFDYFGTGDSMGEDVEGDLDGWVEDIVQADQELRQRSRFNRTVWLGMRLGASLALLAANRAPPDLAQLILWDPVTLGMDYLEHLHARHLACLNEAFGSDKFSGSSNEAGSAENRTLDALGFRISPKLARQLAGYKIAAPAWPHQPVSIVAITEPDGIDGREWKAFANAQQGRVSTYSLKHGMEWASDDAEGSLVCAPALEQLALHVRARQ